MAAISAPVATFFTSAATSAGFTSAASAIGAIAGNVAVGIAAGAVVGAATAAISGGNILEGALKGAVIGGVGAGVISGLSMAANAATGGTIGASATQQLAGMGVGASPASMSAAAEGNALAAAGIGKAGTVGGGGWAGSGAGVNAGWEASKFIKNVGGSSDGETDNTDKDNKNPFGMSDGTMKVVAGVGEGAAGALLEKDKPTQAEYAEWVQKNNLVPEVSAEVADFTQKTGNIAIPNFWEEKYKRITTPNPQKPILNTRPKQQTPGILAQEMA